MATYQCHCDPTTLCRMKLIASCIAFWRPVVSHEPSVLIPSSDHSAHFEFFVNDVYHFFINIWFCLHSAESPSDAIQIYTRSKKTN